METPTKGMPPSMGFAGTPPRGDASAAAPPPVIRGEYNKNHIPKNIAREEGLILMSSDPIIIAGKEIIRRFTNMEQSKNFNKYYLTIAHTNNINALMQYLQPGAQQMLQDFINAQHKKGKSTKFHNVIQYFTKLNEDYMRQLETAGQLPDEWKKRGGRRRHRSNRNYKRTNRNRNRNSKGKSNRHARTRKN